jgi:DNA processing protein
VSLPVNRDAWLILRLVPEIGRMRFHRLIEAFGSPEAALGAGVPALLRVPGMDTPSAENVARHADLVDLTREKELIELNHARIITLHDDEYPLNLRYSFLPPPLIYVRGELEKADRFAIAVVGSRMSTTYGRMTTDAIVQELVKAGLVIVSGLALGIDASAHASAIRHGGRTIAVLANGLARCYPAEHRGLMEEIATHGALISEYPMDEEPAKMNFPERNRIIAALCLGTIVAEAPKKSGALITADMTLDENRSLYAVPGDVNRKSAQGCNNLIQKGAAKLIMNGTDVLEDLHGQLRGLLKEEGIETEAAQPEPRIPMSEDEERVCATLANGPVAIDEILAGTEGLGRGRVATILLSLEMKKIIRQLPGKVFQMQ